MYERCKEYATALVIPSKCQYEAAVGKTFVVIVEKPRSEILKVMGWEEHVIKNQKSVALGACGIANYYQVPTSC